MRVYLDNNFLNLCFKCSRTSVEKKLTPLFKNSGEDRYNFILTYFGFLESIGIRSTFVENVKCRSSYIEKIKHYKKINDINRCHDLVSDLIVEIFQQYECQLKNSEKLDTNYLLAKYREQRSHCTDGLWLFDDIVSRNVDNIDNYREGLIEWLAFDRILGQLYPKDAKYFASTWLIHEANHFLKDQRNNSFAKLYFNIGRELIKEVKDKNNEEIEALLCNVSRVTTANPRLKMKLIGKVNRLKRMNRLRSTLVEKVYNLSKYGHSRDNVDSEIIHFLLFGYQEPDSEKTKVSVVSCDRVEVIVARLCLYKGFLVQGYGFSKFGDLSLLTGDFFHYCKDQKRITHHVDVSKIIDFLHLDKKCISYEYMYSKCVKNV